MYSRLNRYHKVKPAQIQSRKMCPYCAYYDRHYALLCLMTTVT